MLSQLAPLTSNLPKLYEITPIAKHHLMDTLYFWKRYYGNGKATETTTLKFDFFQHEPLIYYTCSCINMYIVTQIETCN